MKYANYGVKVALVVFLALPLLFPDWPQYEGKAMAGRALTYPIAMLIVPVVWSLVYRRRGTPYPHDVDFLLVLPFAIDMAGNFANLYDTVDWWDDANHLVNWGILSLGFGRLMARVITDRWVLFGLTVGFGAATAILWELAEYVTFIRGNANELATAYTDTLGDLALGLTGSCVAAVIAARTLHAQPA
jgi:hypothetical protein